MDEDISIPGKSCKAPIAISSAFKRPDRCRADGDDPLSLRLGPVERVSSLWIDLIALCMHMMILYPLGSHWKERTGTDVKRDLMDRNPH